MLRCPGTLEAKAMNSNQEKLKNLLMDIFLLSDAEFRFSLKREEVKNWDSLGTVSIAVGVQEAFGYHLTPDEAIGVSGFDDMIHILESKGICFCD
jgi:acyl carrier protein